MITIKPISNLRNYNEVLQDVADKSLVFLTKNGRTLMFEIKLAPQAAADLLEIKNCGKYVSFPTDYKFVFCLEKANSV